MSPPAVTNKKPNKYQNKQVQKQNCMRRKFHGGRNHQKYWENWNSNQYNDYNNPRYHNNQQQHFYNNSNEVPNYYPFEYGTDNHNKSDSRKKGNSRQNSRPQSPFRGTEEHTMKKIQEASDMIKQKVLSPEYVSNSAPSSTQPAKNTKKVKKVGKQTKKADKQQKKVRPNRVPNNQRKKPTKKTNHLQTRKRMQPQQQYNVEEIHNKIISHITNLSHAKKMNFIASTTTTGYDSVIQQIQKQKRLEVSKALRELCSNKSPENTDYINSIIPDIGVKIEDLPMFIIQQLSSTLDVEMEIGDDINFPMPLIEPEIKPKPPHQPIVEHTQSVPCLITDSPFIDLVSEIKQEIAESIVDSTQQADILENFELNQSDAVECIESSSKSLQFASVQTNSPLLKSTASQTFDAHDMAQINNIHSAVKTMYSIDQEIARLTKMRQAVFENLCNQTPNSLDNNSKNSLEENCSDFFNKEIQFDINDKVLATIVVKNMLLAGTDKGALIYINLQNGSIMQTIFVTNMPITCICHKDDSIFLGSLDGSLRKYDFLCKNLVAVHKFTDGIQCLEMCWGYLFIGTTTGDLHRLSFSKNKIEFEEKISGDSVLVLKATNEGSRRVLLVGTRNAPVCVRDAMSGLHMRTFNQVFQGIISPTVYAISIVNSTVYCGTNSGILLFSFHDGDLLHSYANCKGVTCMKLHDHLLFAASSDGNIYVFWMSAIDPVGRSVGMIPGPGKMILSMEIVHNMIIVGTICSSFCSILIPEAIREQNSKRI